MKVVRRDPEIDAWFCPKDGDELSLNDFPDWLLAGGVQFQDGRYVGYGVDQYQSSYEVEFLASHIYVNEPEGLNHYSEDAFKEIYEPVVERPLTGPTNPTDYYGMTGTRNV